MIYAIEKEDFKVEDIIRTDIIKDGNDFQWEIYHIRDGYILSYVGDKYFFENYFLCELEHEEIYVKNTNYIHIKKNENISISKITTIIQNKYTDDIYEFLSNLFSLRLKNNPKLLKTEFL